jgi:transposase InsO family protein
LFLDLYDRSVVGYEVGDSNNNNTLVFNTFKKSIEANPDAHPLFHSDGGYQYTSPTFISMLKNQGIEQSMSRVHFCIDNGPMEGFWGIMKCEMYHYGKRYNTKEELIKAIDEWIYYYTYVRYQRRFRVKTPFEVRSEA